MLYESTVTHPITLHLCTCIECLFCLLRPCLPPLQQHWNKRERGPEGAWESGKKSSQSSWAGKTMFIVKEWQERGHVDSMEKEKSRANERPKTSLLWVQNLALSTWQRKETDDNYHHDEILQGLFGVSVVLTDFRRPPPSSQQRPRKQLSYSSSDSEADEKLSKELHLILAEPKEPVKRRIGKIRKRQRKIE